MKLRLIAIFLLFSALALAGDVDSDSEEDALIDGYFKSLDNVLVNVDERLKELPSEERSKIEQSVGKTEHRVKQIFDNLFGILRGEGIDRTDVGDYHVPSIREKFKNATPKLNLDRAHVCVHETTPKFKTDLVEEDGWCQVYSNARLCVQKPDPESRTTVRVEKCCEGFDTEDFAHSGCSIEVEQRLSELLEVMNKTDVSATNSTIIMNEETEKLFVLPKISDIYEWSDGEILKTKEDVSFKVRARKAANGVMNVSLNCAPVKKSWKAIDGNVVEFENDLKPIVADSLLNVLKEPRFSVFSSLIGEKMRTYLETTTSATVFAFTDDVFNKMPDDVKNQIRDTSDCQNELMEQHFVDEALCSADIRGAVKSLRKKMIPTTILDNGTISVGGAKIVEADLFTGNGVLHLIDDVILFEKATPWRVMLRKFNEDLAAKLEKVEVRLPLTVFVPRNETPSSVKNLLVSGQMMTDFQGVSFLKTDAGSTIFVENGPTVSRLLASTGNTKVSPNVRIGCSRIVAPAIPTCQAMLHFVDKPLAETEGTVEQFLASTPDLSKFHSLWKQANLSKLFDEEETPLLTVFAPSDDAFSNNFFAKLERDVSKAEDFVKRHVIRKVLCGDDLKVLRDDFTRVTSLDDSTLTSSTNEDNQPTINGAVVAKPEKVCSDGVVHILESPMTSAVKPKPYRPRPFSRPYSRRVHYETNRDFLPLEVLNIIPSILG
ncbi:unnamed protein product [Caenorhabditis auriculariae]|uniref:FAS1 domain-containing protein n=1 Tax=Caenorhabditis auriculariae TaxID=2777116 RepID=A0A8S1H851_9PELO|nr:unnamed protein product [Caenorhabditis auriculariae]